MEANDHQGPGYIAVGLTAALTLVDLVWVRPMNGPARRMDGPAFRALHRQAVRVGGTAAPILAVPTLIASIVALIRRRRTGESILSNVAGMACLAANAAITFAIIVPLIGSSPTTPNCRRTGGGCGGSGCTLTMRGPPSSWSAWPRPCAPRDDQSRPNPSDPDRRDVTSAATRRRKGRGCDGSAV